MPVRAQRWYAVTAAKLSAWKQPLYEIDEKKRWSGTLEAEAACLTTGQIASRPYEERLP